jgi:ADP-ribose pyrophosphatase YjhB (NUDIX family)
MDSLHAVAVLIASPEGTPLVRDPKKPIPHYWKLPGGRSEGKETPEECAVREIYQELGLKIDIDALEVIEQQDRRSHTLTFFRIDLPSLKDLKKVGDEQEEIHVYKSLLEIGKMQDFFPNHREIVQKAALSLKK